MDDKLNFTNKVVIITGSSSGIGAATAQAFARYGANLTLVGRNEERLEEVAQCCEVINGRKPLRVLLDLTQPGNCELLVTRTVAAYGKIDVLINCASQAKIATVFEDDMKTFDDMMTINLRVPYLLTQLALPHLSATKGNIVNIGSTFTNRYRQGLMPYMLSKIALQKFSEYAAVEVASEGVRVNCINPGVTRTTIMQHLNALEQFETLFNIAEDMNRTIEPKEMAVLICITASGMFPSASGSVINLDGGMSYF